MQNGQPLTPGAQKVILALSIFWIAFGIAFLVIGIVDKSLVAGIVGGFSLIINITMFVRQRRAERPL